MTSPLENAEVIEVFQNRWLMYSTGSEEGDRDLAYYIAMHSTQDELLEFVEMEAAEFPRRVLYTGPGGEFVPGFLYLDYGITLVPSVPAGAPLPPGGKRRDEILELVGRYHRHFPRPPASYLWAYTIYNGSWLTDETLIGVALVGVPGPHAYAQELAGKGPRLATVTRVALDSWLPQEVTYQAASMVYDAAAQEAYSRGYDFLETYTLVSEHARSLRYSKWRPEGISNKEGRWRKVGWSRPRKESRRGQKRTPEQAQAKWRWWKRLTTKWPWPPKPTQSWSAW